jgi:hypothetical protein
VDQIKPIRQLVEPKTRSGRTTRAPERYKGYVVYESSLVNDSSYDFTDNVDLIALLMTTLQDTLHCHEILREPDKMEFIKSMKDEFDNHNNNQNWIPYDGQTSHRYGQ